MTKRLDLVGQRFERLVVVADGGTKNGGSMWECVCDCGNTKTIYGGSLRGGVTRSCGCLQREQTSKANTTHGQNKIGLVTKEYVVWTHMKSRCCNANDKDYKDYGGRGITVCLRWLESFENFFEDMGRCPEGMSLDRKDNDGDYEPGNCRWATLIEQANNKRNNAWHDYKEERRTIAQWAKHLDVGVGILGDRLNKLGWSVERALTAPVRYKRRLR